MVDVSYLSAIDILVLTSLIMAAGPFAAVRSIRGTRKRLVIALFALALVRSTFLIAALAIGDLPAPLVGSLEIVSSICITWLLLKPAVVRRRLWRIYGLVGLGGAWLLIALIWAVPSRSWLPVAALLTLSAIPLVLDRSKSARWSHPIALFMLAVGFGLFWLGLAEMAQFVSLLAYGVLVYAVFTETAISAETRHKARQQEVTLLGTDAQRRQQEQQRVLEIGHKLGQARDLNNLLDHATEVIGEATDVDHIIFLTFGWPDSGQMDISTGTIAAIFNRQLDGLQSSQTPAHFAVQDYPILLDVLETQRPLMVTSGDDYTALQALCSLWQSHREAGPTVIQPLLINYHVVGMLILSNTTASQWIKRRHIQLCQKLAPQLAAMVAYRQAHDILQHKVEEAATQVQTHRAESDQLLNIVNNMTDGVIASGPGGRIYLVNKAAENLVGQPKSRLLGQPINTIYGNIASNESIEALAADFSRNGQALPTYLERNGKTIQGKLVPLRNGHHGWMGIVAVLRNSASDVHMDIGSNKLFQKLSRELRNSLTTITGYADLMLTGFAGDLDLEQRHFVELIKTGADRATDVINQSDYVVDAVTSTIGDE